MGRVETALKTEIIRLARKEDRSLAKKNAEEFKRLNRKLAMVVNELNALKRRQDAAVSQQRLEKVKETSPEALENTRLSPKLIKKLRKKLKISQPQMARLVGVSNASIGFWESGTVKPRPAMRAKIIGLRQLGRRDVQRLLAQG